MSDKDNFKKFLKGLVSKKSENKLDKKSQKHHAFESEQLHQLYAVATAAHAMLTELRKLMLQYRNVDFDSGVFTSRDFTIAWRFMVCIPFVDGQHYTLRNLINGPGKLLDGSEEPEEVDENEFSNELRAKGHKPIEQTCVSELIKLNEEYARRPITTFGSENPTDDGDTSWVTSLILVAARACASLTKSLFSEQPELYGIKPHDVLANRIYMATQATGALAIDFKNPDFMPLMTSLPVYIETLSALLEARGHKGFDKRSFLNCAYHTQFLRAGISLITMNELMVIIADFYAKLIDYFASVLKEMPGIIEEHLALGEPAFKKWSTKDGDGS